MFTIVTFRIKQQPYNEAIKSNKNCSHLPHSIVRFCLFLCDASTKLPGFFKTAKHRRFDFKTRYYDEQKEKFEERVKNAESGRSNLRFSNHWGPAKRVSANKTANRMVFIIFIALCALSYLILKFREELDIIQLLPNHVANQIAAGEVIQRPASAVKEMLENAIDSGADQIQLIIKDAGKTLIQVVDNGCGMSLTDARMCFERHATSKIKDANDLFAIRTMGFRGEAMASMAAIAHIELKTKLHSENVGTRITIEGSEIKIKKIVLLQKAHLFQ